MTFASARQAGIRLFDLDDFCRLPSCPVAACFGASISSFMSADSDINIDYVANLARLALTAEEKIRFARQLGDILHYVEKLNGVDVSGVEPMAHASPVFNVWQADVPRPGLSVEQALRNAPAQRQNMIAVPKVVE
jgi:aspartyl-tRNA(Asn)/glutamyl-tRNA(Gln) amidotransferase subunit C